MPTRDGRKNGSPLIPRTIGTLKPLMISNFKAGRFGSGMIRNATLALTKISQSLSTAE